MLYPVTSYVVFAECFRLAKWNSTGCLKNVMGRGSSFNGMVVGQPRKIGGFGSTRHGGPQTNHGMSLEIANKFQLWIRSCESGPADELFVVSSRMCVGNPFCL